MVILLNSIICCLILLVLFLVIHIIRILILKRTIKSLYVSLSILLGIILLLAVFYFPRRITLPDQQQLLITIDAKGQDPISLMNVAQLNELVNLVERQKLVKSISKTLEGTFSYPAEHGVNIIIAAMDEPRLYIFARDDNIKQTFFEKNGQYYTVLNSKKFVEDIFKLSERIMPK